MITAGEKRSYPPETLLEKHDSVKRTCIQSHLSKQLNSEKSRTQIQY